MGAAPDVIILNDSSTVRGGATYLALTLAEQLAARGHEVTFVAGDRGSDDMPPGVQLVAIGGQRLLEADRRTALMRGLYNRHAAERVGRLIAERDTQDTVYHLHNWALILSPSIFDALAPVAHRCVIHAHDYFLACPNGAFFDYPRRSACFLTPLSARCIATQCDKRSYPHKLWRVARGAILGRKIAPFLDASQFVVVHERMREGLGRRIAPQRITAIGNPVEPYGAPVPAPDRQKGIFFIGQIQRYKGVFELAEAGRRLGCRVDFFGEGDVRAELMASYPEHTCHGWQSRAAIAARLREARLCVVATQGPETFCLSAFEAVATGLPLVVSEAILAADTLIESGAALGFRAADVNALTAVLDRLMRDKALVAQLAGAARAHGPHLSQSLEAWVTAHRILYAERTAKAVAVQ